MDFRTPEDLLGLKNKLPFSPGWFSAAISILVGIVLLSTAFYQIGPDERGVVLFLGKFSRTTPPGLHMKIPFNVETVVPVKVERIFKEEFGFRTDKPGVRTTYSNRNYLNESLMLTGDLNALEVTWIVQFKVKDAYRLLFIVRDPVTAIRDVSEAVMRRLVGDYSVDEVLTTKRIDISALAEEEIQKILDSYGAGIDIVTVKLQDVTPPGKVRSAFNEVNEAKQEKERMINQALQKYNNIIPKAQGQAEKQVLEAEAYSVERTNRALGDADRFKSLLAEYEAAPAITRSRLYLESMERVLVKPKEKFILDPKGAEQILPLVDFRKKGEV